MVLSYLAQFGKADHTESVIKALKLAEHHPSRWVQELQTLAEQSLLDGFLASCQKNAEWAAAKGHEEPSRRSGLLLKGLMRSRAEGDPAAASKRGKSRPGRSRSRSRSRSPRKRRLP